MLLHILVITIVLIIPVGSYCVLELMKKRRQETDKTLAYISIYLVYWFYTAILSLDYQIGNLVFAQHSFSIPWWAIVMVVAAVLWGAATTFLPQLVFNSNQNVRETILEDYRNESHIFPTTTHQQLMMVFVAITVGITEEIIYRGFLYNYLIEVWNLPAILSLFIAAVLFGLGHFAQGGKEVIDSAVFGVLMGLIYILTGSLFLPIVLHILYDLKIVTMTRIIQRYESKQGM